MSFTVTEEWLEENDVDIFAFLDALEDMGLSTDPDENGNWVLTGMTDDDNNNIPDFLDALIGSASGMTPSQHGHGG